MQQPPEELGEDLYTSATADLSAGGVAMARESAEEQDSMPGGTLGHASPPPPTAPINDPTPAQIYAREDLVSSTERPTFVTDYSGVDEASDEGGIDPIWAITGGGAVALGGGIAGAWLYSRWQQQRNRPINRLRRRARGMTSMMADVFDEVSGRLPEAEDVRGRAPVGGGALGTMLLGLALARAVHLGGWGQSEPTPSTETLRETARGSARWGRRLQDVDVQGMRKKIPSADVKAAREKLRSVDVKAARQRVQSTPRKPIGLGLGGIIGLAAVAFLAWRLLRGGGSAQSQPNWYYGDDRRDEVPNQ